MTDINPLPTKKNNFPVVAAVTLLVLAATFFGYRYAIKPDSSTTPPPPPVSTDQKYSNDSLGISFTYPKDFYAVEDLDRKVVNIRNAKDIPADDSANFQTIGVSYDSNAAAYENAIPSLNGSKRIDIQVTGGTIRLYTYQNPSYPDRTLAMAFFTGKYAFTVNMGWNAYDPSQDEATREANEVALIKKLVPTIVISK